MHVFMLGQHTELTVNLKAVATLNSSLMSLMNPFQRVLQLLHFSASSAGCVSTFSAFWFHATLIVEIKILEKAPSRTCPVWSSYLFSTGPKISFYISSLRSMERLNVRVSTKKLCTAWGERRITHTSRCCWYKKVYKANVSIRRVEGKWSPLPLRRATSSGLNAQPPAWHSRADFLLHPAEVFGLEDEAAATWCLQKSYFVFISKHGEWRI